MLTFHSIKKIVYVSVIAFAVVLTAGGDVFAQKGHGKGGGNGHGHGNGNGGGNGNGRGHQPTQFGGWDNGQGHGRQKQWGGWEMKRQQKADHWEMKRQQKADDWNVRRQQQVNEWNVRRQQAEWNARRQQQVDEWNVRRQQKMNDWNARRQQQINEWNQRRRRQNEWQQVWTNKRDRDRDDDRRGRWNGRRQQNVYYSPERIFPGIAVNGFRDDKHYRRDMKWAWKAERRAQKRFEKEQRRYARRAGNSYYFGDNNYYANNYYDDDFDRGPDWRQQIIRAIIGNVTGGGFDNDRYDDYRRYQPRYYTSPTYARYESRPAYYNSPLYVGYGDDYSYDPEYAAYDGDSGLGDLLNQLPIGDIIGQFIGDDFVSGLLGNFLAQGYDEGFLAGQWARENGQGDRYFDDPYEYDGVYDPYSTSLGQNRQILSEGYCLGFEDALNGREDYDPLAEGNVDLISALLGNVLGNG